MKGRPVFAAIQMCSTPDKRANLDQAEALLDEGARQGAGLLALPENCALLAEGSEAVLAGAETLEGETVGRFRRWAKARKAWLLAGSLQIKAPRDPRRITNTSLLIGPTGRIAARYDKIHLFDVDLPDRKYRESRTVKPGSKVVSARTPWGIAALNICYDLRFPELFRRHADKGADFMFLPSAFTVPTGEAHWDILTRTRAVENQCYFIAPAQEGENHPGRRTYGHTRIIDPWGRVIAEVVKGTGVALAELSADVLAQIRRDLPALKHRRL